jgi:hypothetical protein
MNKSVQQAVNALRETPLPLADARENIPPKPGIYAWWMIKESISGGHAPAHPSVRDLKLLYVGIAPNSPTSSATLRSRVISNHMRGNIAASTLRRTLAALLVKRLKLAPEKRGTKVVLPNDQNAKLSAWQDEHLRLTWFAYPKPWEIEEDVIQELAPPLNLAGNRDHAFHKTLSAARKALQDLAT